MATGISIRWADSMLYGMKVGNGQMVSYRAMVEGCPANLSMSPLQTYAAMRLEILMKSIITASEASFGHLQ